jgi:NAD(P)-dependent dehydrogenase (short-subunit alcohol dehydrogenase family)
MSRDFEHKIVVITGGSRGIGRAIAAAFAREGAQTVLASSSGQNLRDAAEIVGKAGGPPPLTCAGDLKQLEKCEGLFELVSTRFGRCDALVNCAGATKAGNFLELYDEEWHDGFALKFFAAVRLSRLFWPMLKTAKGSIVNIAGGAARTPDQSFLIGGSVNAALTNFSKGLADLGKRDGVNVNVIHPGPTETERFFELAEARARAANISREDAIQRAIQKSGVRRIGKPEDVAELALFLCSKRSAHINGTAIAVDGGASPGVS